MEPARLFLVKFFGQINKTKIVAYQKELNVVCDFNQNEQIAPVKLAMIPRAGTFFFFLTFVHQIDLENPEYEVGSFGMITYKACQVILKSYKVWIPLLNRHMKGELEFLKLGN
jgi:hypothetical protein